MAKKSKLKKHDWKQCLDPFFGKVEWCEDCGSYRNPKKERRACEPQPWPVVRLECIKSLGYALVYLQYLHRDFDFGGQLKRVKSLCDELAKNQRKDDSKYWVLLQRRISEEIENLC
jgi:hypothetical protein